MPAMNDNQQYGAWAIVPDYIDRMTADAQMVEINETLMGEYLALSDKVSSSEKGYRVVDGNVAVIDMVGPMAKRMTFSMWLAGAQTYDAIARSVTDAAADDAVAAIVLSIDSPGGTVSGVESLSMAIESANAKKPVVAFANGTMASAAYWVGSGASQIVAERTAAVGSIGVVYVHLEVSKAADKWGYTFTVFQAGRFKAAGNPYEKLSGDAVEIIQGELDAYYSLFIEAVAGHRNASTEQVRKDMADGRIFIGADAQAAGLVDKIGTYEDAIALAGTLAAERSPYFHLLYGGKKMNSKQLKTEHPELYNEVYQEGFDAAAADARNEGILAERERVTAILDADGDPEATTSAIRDGVSADGAFKLFFEAEKEKRAQGLRDMQSQAPPAAGAEAPDGDQPTGEEGMPADKIVARRAVKLGREQKISYAAAMRKVLADDPELHKQYKALMEVPS